MKKVLIVLCILLGIIITYGIVQYSKNIKANKVVVSGDSTEAKVDKSDINISEETHQKSEEKKIQNILVLGIDKQENASDSIVILTLDKANNTAKLTSIMRDTYVYFGDGMANKINYAYHYGGVQLTISKLNELFNLDISKYIKIDFNGLIKAVDTLGGITVNITNEEKNNINNSCYKKITDSGEVELDGDQVLAYSRIRKIDSDFERTARQRKVLFAMFNNLKKISIADYPTVYSEMTPYVDTNMQAFEILNLGLFLNKLNSDSIKDFRIPIDGTTKDNENDVYHLDWDKEKNTEALHNFIYGSAEN